MVASGDPPGNFCPGEVNFCPRNHSDPKSAPGHKGRAKCEFEMCGGAMVPCGMWGEGGTADAPESLA